jgi:uncharacterized protein YjiS (DUF1127 family)
MTSRTSNGGLRATWRDWRRFQKTIGALGKLTDRELSDIGLWRDDADRFHPWTHPQH